MPIHASYTARGASGDTYDFRICARIADLPETPGLYVFLRVDTGVLGIATPLYFGRAETSLADRIHSHDKWHEALSLGINAIGVLECPDIAPDALRSREQDLVQGAVTPLNTAPQPAGGAVPGVTPLH